MNEPNPAPLATLLLVDDEENILSSLRRLLRNQGYEIFTATGGEQALAMLEERPVDLVISDARMPGMDGATLLAEVQRRWPDCMRILLTGYADIGTTINLSISAATARRISGGRTCLRFSALNSMSWMRPTGSAPCSRKAQRALLPGGRFR